MSAHSSKALKCACGGYFIFGEYHWPHCPANRKRSAISKESLFEQARALTVVSIREDRMLAPLEIKIVIHNDGKVTV